MRYEVHDNGGRPFAVTVEDNTVTVQNLYTNDVLYAGSDIASVHVGGVDGNSILLHLSHDNYMWIGWKVLKFCLHDGADGVARFESPIGNSDVPYPYAVTHDGAVYFFLDEKYTFDVDAQAADPYTAMYRNPNVVKHPFVHSLILHDRP